MGLIYLLRLVISFQQTFCTVAFGLLKWVIFQPVSARTFLVATQTVYFTLLSQKCTSHLLTIIDQLT